MSKNWKNSIEFNFKMFEKWENKVKKFNWIRLNEISKIEIWKFEIWKFENWKIEIWKFEKLKFENLKMFEQFSWIEWIHLNSRLNFVSKLQQLPVNFVLTEKSLFVSHRGDWRQR